MPRLVMRAGSERLLVYGAGAAASAWHPPWGIEGVEPAGAGSWGLAVPLFLFVSKSGLIIANSIAGDAADFPERAGSVSAPGAISCGSGIGLVRHWLALFANSARATMGGSSVIGIAGVGSFPCAGVVSSNEGAPDFRRLRLPGRAAMRKNWPDAVSPSIAERGECGSPLPSAAAPALTGLHRAPSKSRLCALLHLQRTGGRRMAEPVQLERSPGLAARGCSRRRSMAYGLVSQRRVAEGNGALKSRRATPVDLSPARMPPCALHGVATVHRPSGESIRSQVP